jgi:hypothetical protein
MNYFYEYLMFDMAEDINSSWDTESERAHEFCFILSLLEDEVPETFFKMYASQINASEQCIENALAYFSGMNLLSVFCDCAPDWKSTCEIYNLEDSKFYQIGNESFLSKDKNWELTNERLVLARLEIKDVS